MEAVEQQVAQAADASHECVGQEYVGRWNRLVSTTNWQKGEIIRQWRDVLRQSGAAAEEYTDEAWSRRVGGVTPQHVGRLRRVYERFGDTHEQYEGLYWSHFHAAVEWPDAEMYLEGAVQNGWSVPKMRDQRKETVGAVETETEQDASDLEFSQPEAGSTADAEEKPPATISETISEVRGYDDDDEEADGAEHSSSGSAMPESLAAVADSPTVRPFESLPPLPPDVKEAFELMKLAVLAHKVAGWRDIDRDDMLSVLASLRQLALAPAE